MEENKIMVGNWVFSTFSPNPCKVEAIELHKSGYASVKVSCVEGYKDINSLMPIPLTADILHKNGFYCVGPDMCLQEKGYVIFLNPKDPSDCNKDDFWLHISIMTINIKYVHQLQNVFNLIGLDKKFVL